MVMFRVVGTDGFSIRKEHFLFYKLRAWGRKDSRGGCLRPDGAISRQTEIGFDLVDECVMLPLRIRTTLVKTTCSRGPDTTPRSGALACPRSGLYCPACPVRLVLSGLSFRSVTPRDTLRPAGFCASQAALRSYPGSRMRTTVFQVHSTRHLSTPVCSGDTSGART